MNRVGEKYIIEIAQELDADMTCLYKDSLGKVPRKLYRAVGFNSLVFDDEGLKKLEKIDGDASSKSYSDGYNKGLEDAWKTAQRIYGFNKDTCLMTTAFNYPEIAIDNLEVRDAIKKVIKYDNDVNNLKVGDIVKWVGEEYIIVTLNKKAGTAKLLKEKSFEIVYCSYIGILKKVPECKDKNIIKFINGEQDE